MNHWWHLVYSKVMISVEFHQFTVFLSLFQAKCSHAVNMATDMQMDERSVDCLVLCHIDHHGKVSAKSVTMRATTLCKI